MHKNEETNSIYYENNILICFTSLTNIHSWKDSKNDKVFLSKEQVLKLFEDFEIVYFKEIDKDGESAVGEEKHWHYFNIIARKM